MLGVINLSKGEAINLSKHTSIDLSKGGNGLSKVLIGLGWDSNTNGKKQGFWGSLLGIDCDAFVCELNELKQVSNDKSIVAFYNLNNINGSIRHSGDNLTGSSHSGLKKDDEQIRVDLTNLPQGVTELLIGVSLFGAKFKKQDMGILSNAYVRIVDDTTNQELCKYTLSDSYSGKYGMIFGKLSLQGKDWVFEALGEGCNVSSVRDIVNEYVNKIR